MAHAGVLEKIVIGAEEKTQQLRTFTAIAEDLSLLPSIHGLANCCLCLQF